MPATALDSLIFRDIFSTPEMRQVFSDEARTGYYLEIEAALARAQGRLGIIPEDAMHEIVSKCRIENIDLRQAQAADRAHRLSDPRRGAADRRPVQGRARRVVPLGRDHAGHHRHRRHPADPRRARSGRKGYGGDRRLRSPSLSRRYRDTPMAGRSNLQQAVPLTFGFKMARALGRHAAPSRAARADAPARAGRRVRRRRRQPGLARHARPQGAGGADAGSSASASRRSPGTRCATASARSAASSACSPARSARFRWT